MKYVVKEIVAQRIFIKGFPDIRADIAKEINRHHRYPSCRAVMSSKISAYDNSTLLGDIRCCKPLEFAVGLALHTLFTGCPVGSDGFLGKRMSLFINIRIARYPECMVMR